jgi:hypothetical protein
MSGLNRWGPNQISAMMQLLDKSPMSAQRKRQFLFGTMLTWIPFLFFALSLSDLGRPHQGPVGAMFTSIFYGFPLVGFSIGWGGKLWRSRYWFADLSVQIPSTAFCLLLTSLVIC